MYNNHSVKQSLAVREMGMLLNLTDTGLYINAVFGPTVGLPCGTAYLSSICLFVTYVLWLNGKS